MDGLKLDQVYSNEVVGSSSGGTFDDLAAFRVERGYLFEVRHVSVVNRTSDFTKLEVGVTEGNVFLAKEQETNLTADELYWTRSRFFVPEGCQLKVRFFGCTSGDELHLVYEGFLYRME